MPLPLFADRICAVVAAPTAAGMLRQLACALRHTRTVELRLDWLRSRRQILLLLAALARRRLRATCIATCRRRVAGGRFVGSPTAQLELLRRAVAAGCHWCDVEIETAARLGAADLRRRLAPARCLISFHDFAGTPRRLAALSARLERGGGSAVKLATRCDGLRDGLRLLALAHRHRRVVAVPMGERALPLRVLALRAGSALAYAAAGEPTAPGQLTLEEMRYLYRADQLDRRTRVYGLIGDPVAHSLSPLLHNTGFRVRRINAVYLPFLVPAAAGSAGLRDFLAAVPVLGIRGFSVTIPHKERILEYLDGCDPLAEQIGAVNTVVVRGTGQLYGYNTDYVGVLRALHSRSVDLASCRVLICGAGGAARAVAFALAQAGAQVAICARRPAPARRLARAVGGEIIPRMRLAREFFDAIVNATPVGMHPHVHESPLALRELNCRIVFDLIYRPMQTKLLALAARRGIETISGAEMFVAQGVAQWEIWMGERAPERQMRAAVLAALRNERNLRR
ncbi:MAG: shikimate dehydrogenase [Acidobacteriia bacterium]|nr:shikimate dehydrogenase [Terriglobia bacterium]